MDRRTKQQRSYNMSRVRSKNTKPEVLIFSMLKDAGFKFRRHYEIHGKPDIAFPKQKIAIFVDGEFWHGKNFGKWKSSLSHFWLKKISDNIKRDKMNAKLLKREGWRSLHLWGKAITRKPEVAFSKIVKFIEKSDE